MPDLWRDTPPFIVFSCEHAGNGVPPQYEDLFAGRQDALQSHRGYDLGALEVALKLASRLAAPIQFTEITRLLIDANRSEHNPQLFSVLSQSVSAAERELILEQFYRPHRSGLERMIAALIRSGHKVLHIAVHSFVDVLDDQPRELDIGLLFDPERICEANIAARWLNSLDVDRTKLRCVGNQPYLGTDDGLTTAFRQCFDVAQYAGIEVEIRQGLLKSRTDRKRVIDVIADSLRLLVI